MKTIFNVILFILLTVNYAIINAKDVIKLPQSSSKTDNRFKYPEHILKLALTASIDQYGPFEIIYTNFQGKRDRMLIELQRGIHINVHNAPTKPEWEKKVTPVMFPLLKGILNYRIFLIHQDNLEKFKKLETIEDLKQLSAGVGSQWSTTKALRLAEGFNIRTGISYEGLFGMLANKRFDYLIRGMNEVFREYEERKNIYPQMRIEPYVLMELPLPWFFFVSPKDERIAQRIKYGLEKMKDDGSFDKEFYAYFEDDIKKANLHNRKLFQVKNMLLTPHKIYDDPSYWLNINKLK